MQLKTLIKSLRWPSLVLLMLTVPFVVTNLDLTMASWFYHHGWPNGDRPPWSWLYHYGTLPGLLLGIGGLVVFLGSWIWTRFQPQRRAAALILLTLLVGPGLLINVLGKGYWGRPRPRDVVQFGGQQAFHRLYQPGLPGRGKSFPCGHASVGFLLVALALTDKKRKSFWLVTGFGFGTLMGIARMAQGAHFASDVLWAGGLTYLPALVLDQVLPAASSVQTRAASTSKKVMAFIALGLSLLLLTAFFLLATPYFKVLKKKIPDPGTIAFVRLDLGSAQEQVKVVQADQQEALILQAQYHGFGYPKLQLTGTTSSTVEGNTLNVSARFQLKGLVTEKSGQIDVTVKKGLKLTIDH